METYIHSLSKSFPLYSAGGFEQLHNFFIRLVISPIAEKQIWVFLPWILKSLEMALTNQQQLLMSHKTGRQMGKYG